MPITSKYYCSLIAVWILLISILSASTAASAELEAGIGIGYAHVPDYIGSDEAEDYVLPFPYLRYRSENFSVDRNAVQGNLWRSGNWSLELSFGGAVRVKSDDNEAREGMDDLDFVGEAGPALHYYFRGDRNSDNALFLMLPLRSAASTDFSSITLRGMTFNPTLRWRRIYSINSVAVRPQLSLVMRSASQAYHEYFYGVEREFETAEREAYSANAGYGGYSINYSTALLWDSYLIAGFVGYSDIRDATFSDSPLVRQNSNLTFGLAAAYVF
ncbi:MipA/OmpV family protein [Bacterioplanoides sp.]|uniref:MipA/OmpV family protein n=1 Tax=Bacterioplanoides sp. TaxID=2066072 RepID=UPI003AFF77C7